MFSLTALADYSTHPPTGIYVINADGSGLRQVIGDQDYKALFGWWK